MDAQAGVNSDTTMNTQMNTQASANTQGVVIGDADKQASADAAALGNTSTDYKRRNRASDFTREQQITDNLNAQAIMRAKAS